MSPDPGFLAPLVQLARGGAPLTLAPASAPVPAAPGPVPPDPVPPDPVPSDPASSEPGASGPAFPDPGASGPAFPDPRASGPAVPADRDGRSPGPRRAAVLVAVAGDAIEHASVALLQRSAVSRRQPGHIAFPGGGVEAVDASPAATALREAGEEVRLEARDLTVHATFSPARIGPLGFEVRPVLARAAYAAPLAVGDPDEVASARWIPLRDLADPSRRGRTHLGEGAIGPAFRLDDWFVWGFTALTLEGMLRGLGLAREVPAPLWPVPAALRGGAR